MAVLESAVEVEVPLLVVVVVVLLVLEVVLCVLLRVVLCLLKLDVCLLVATPVLLSLSLWLVALALFDVLDLSPLTWVLSLCPLCLSVRLWKPILASDPRVRCLLLVVCPEVLPVDL